MGKWSVVRVEPGAMPLAEYVSGLIKMTAARVPRASGHKFVTTANQQFPFAYRHLKRTRPENDDLLILLAPVVDDTKVELEGALEHRTISVPSYAPMNREQYEAGSAIWPMVFHENKKEQDKQDFDDQISELVNTHFETLTRDHHISILKADGRLIAHGDTDTSHPLGHSVMKAIEMAATVVEPPDYLCTDLIVFCREEPCLMCAMALLHSRIAAIVFERPRSEDRPFAHPINLQVQAGLNHYYKVYHASREK